MMWTCVILIQHVMSADVESILFYGACNSTCLWMCVTLIQHVMSADVPSISMTQVIFVVSRQFAKHTMHLIEPDRKWLSPSDDENTVVLALHLG